MSLKIVRPEELVDERLRQVNELEDTWKHCMVEDISSINNRIIKVVKRNPKEESTLVYRDFSWGKSVPGYSKTRYIQEIKKKIKEAGYRIYECPFADGDDGKPADQIEIYIPELESS